MKEFEILEHTADIGIAAYGKPGGPKTLKKTFMIK